MAFEGLPTLAEVSAVRQAVPKSELPTRMDKAIAKKRAIVEDVAKLKVWSRQVKDRDGWKDRYTGKKVIGKRHALDPDCAHAHHVEPRENTDTRYDTRNGITLSAKTHDLVERNKLKIVGTVWFTVKGKRYINCDYPVKFIEPGFTESDMSDDQKEFRAFCRESATDHILGDYNEVIAHLLRWGYIREQQIPHYRLPAKEGLHG